MRDYFRWGEWGFVMATDNEFMPPAIPPNLTTQYLEAGRLNHHFEFAPDLLPTEVVLPNRLDQPVLLDYYLQEWKSWRKEKIQ